MPHLKRLRRDHFKIAADSANAARPTIDGGPIEGYVLGHALTIEQTVRVDSSDAPHRPGSLWFEGDKLLYQITANETLHATAFELYIFEQSVRTFSEARRALTLNQPFFVSKERFPCAEIVSLYELLPYIDSAVQAITGKPLAIDPTAKLDTGGLRKDELRNGQTESSANAPTTLDQTPEQVNAKRSADEQKLVDQNATFCAWLFRSVPSRGSRSWRPGYRLRERLAGRRHERCGRAIRYRHRSTPQLAQVFRSKLQLVHRWPPGHGRHVQVVLRP